MLYKEFCLTLVSVDTFPIGADVPVPGTLIQVHALLVLIGLLALWAQTLKGSNQIDALSISETKDMFHCLEPSFQQVNIWVTPAQPWDGFALVNVHALSGVDIF